jgi:hypothetical protein
VTPGSGQLLDFVTAADETAPKNAVGSAAAAKTEEAKQHERQESNAVMTQVRTPGKFHRLLRYGIAQLPAHPQDIDANGVYFAELEAPLDFGSEPLTPEMVHSIGDISPSGGVVDARLRVGVTSAQNHKRDPVDGQLRVAFLELKLPIGTEQANLETVEARKSSGVKLDPEGGAQATTPKTRCLSTAVELGLAGLSVRGDPDAKTPNPAGDTGNRLAGGTAGFKVVGAALGIFVHSGRLGLRWAPTGPECRFILTSLRAGRMWCFRKIRRSGRVSQAPSSNLRQTRAAGSRSSHPAGTA